MAERAGIEKFGVDDFRELFPASVSLCVGSHEMYGAPLFAEEERFVARATAQRRREFAAGRACARLALRKLGVEAGPIAVGKRGAPVWPVGCVGSIAHTANFCAAVAAKRQDLAGIGFDAEDATPLGAAASAVLTRREHDICRAAPRRSDLDWPKLIFSAKEALYKCWFPLYQTPLDFPDVEVTLTSSVDANRGSFQVRLVHTSPPPRLGLRCRWGVGGGTLFTAVTLLERAHGVPPS